MSTKYLSVPNDILRSTQPGEDENIRLLQYVSSTTRENFDVFLTHRALVYIPSGVRQIKMEGSQFDIRPGELFLVSRGEHMMSEYITGEHGFRSLMLFFSRRVAQGPAEQLSRCLSERTSERMPTKREAIRIIPRNREVEKLSSLLEEYSKSKSLFMCELIRLKFTELVYLLLGNSYQQLIASFLLDTTRSESPALSTVLDQCSYPPATVSELTTLSSRSLSSSKREFTQEYSEAPREWICRRKLERAAHLLNTSDKAIEEVTDASEPVSAAHFTRFSKEQYQMVLTKCRGRNDE